MSIHRRDLGQDQHGQDDQLGQLARFVDHAPFGHWRTQSFVAALCHDRLDAPWVIDGAMNTEMFKLFIETQLVPTLREGDVVILDNLSSHKSPSFSGAALTQTGVSRNSTPEDPGFLAALSASHGRVLQCSRTEL